MNKRTYFQIVGLGEGLPGTLYCFKTVPVLLVLFLLPVLYHRIVHLSQLKKAKTQGAVTLSWEEEMKLKDAVG